MIYDCFIFFNELDLLEIRLNELDPVVDRFVLVEASVTFQGKAKPLYFNEHKARFEKFLHKIIHVVVEKYPFPEESSAWTYEHYQRNRIADGLKDCAPGDVIIVGDVDEIPDPIAITKYARQKGIKIFRQRMFYYFLNCVNNTELGAKNHYAWNGSVMADYRDMRSPQELRNFAIKYLVKNSPRALVRIIYGLYYKISDLLAGNNLVFISQGGWHFSYLGGVEKIIKKIESFSHTEYNNDAYKDPATIEERINKGEDIFGRGFTYTFVPVDETFPVYIRAHKSKLQQYIKGV